MNFFKLYIGDYQRDTGTLSLAEHGAYMLMLQQFYATEAPLPTGRELYRLLRAETKDERKAVDSVAAKFWTDDGAGLVNIRATEEIAKSQHQRTVNREIGKRGGRPKRTEQEPNDNRIGLDSVTEQEPNDNPIHSQIPEKRKEPPPAPPSGVGAAAPPSRRTQKSAMPDDFALTPELRAKAVRYWAEHDRDDLSPEDEFGKFRSHHAAHGSRFACWESAWTTWYANAVRITPRLRVVTGGKPAPSDEPHWSTQGLVL